MHPTILPVRTEAEIRCVAQLAEVIWKEHYTPIIGDNQVTYMLEHFQSAAAMQRQIAEGYDYFLLRFKTSDAGYFALKPEAGNVFLSKIYIAKQFRNNGLAQAALHFIENYTCDHDADTLWLTVNKYNTLAIGWYEKVGFVTTEAIVQEIGGGFVMDDYRMEKALG